MNVATAFLVQAFTSATKAVKFIDDGISIGHRSSRKYNAEHMIESHQEMNQILSKHNLTMDDLPALDDWMNY